MRYNIGSTVIVNNKHITGKYFDDSFVVYWNDLQGIRAIKRDPESLGADIEMCEYSWSKNQNRYYEKISVEQTDNLYKLISKKYQEIYVRDINGSYILSYDFNTQSFIKLKNRLFLKQKLTRFSLCERSFTFIRLNDYHLQRQ